MKKTFALLLPLLASCSTATLITVDLNVVSFVPSALRSRSIDIPSGGIAPIKALDDGDNNADNGYLVTLPSGASLGALEAFGTELAAQLSANASNTGNGNATIGLYLAPESATNVYQAAYLLSESNADLAAGQSAPLGIQLKLGKNASGTQKTAFDEVKKGKFRLGLLLGFSATSSGKYQLELAKLSANVSAYPILFLVK